jgi:DGQHR domain-containing protein
MAPAQNKDAALKRSVTQVLQNCGLDDAVIDREVQINTSGETDSNLNLLSDKEIDVVVRFSYVGQTVLLLFECEDSNSASGKRKEYKQYAADLKEIESRSDQLQIVNSLDKQIKPRHFQDVDDLRVCFVYGSDFPDEDIKRVQREAEKQGFIVWSYFALQYYLKMSAVLGSWTRYELFKDFSLKLESKSTVTISALLAKQNDRRMYIGKIHPGLLLKIAYVVRRASERTYAYQRMLNKERIESIAQFISSDAPDSFLPNAALIVFDPDSRIQNALKYDEDKSELTLPLAYCSAWIIDGQHRAYGFLGTKFEAWEHDKHKPFDLPIIVFRSLDDVIQTKTFININYYQKRIKAGLLCDLSTLTKDLKYRLTWASLLGRELNSFEKSPLRARVKVSELHFGRPIGLSSLVQYGLLETLLGFRNKTKDYSGPLFEYARFDRSLSFDHKDNQKAFEKQKELLIRFLDGVKKNTETADPSTDPWRNTGLYALLRPTGLNALFMLLAKLLELHPNGGLDFDAALKPFRRVKWNRDYVAKKGGGWKGFRGLANTLIGAFNRGKKKKNKLERYREKDKR